MTIKNYYKVLKILLKFLFLGSSNIFSHKIRRAMQFLLNSEQNRFELHTEGYVAHIEYTTKNKETLDLTHTIVPNELGGKGIGKILVNHVLEYIKANNLRFIPTCSFILSYVQKNPEWKTFLAEKVNL